MKFNEQLKIDKTPENEKLSSKEDNFNHLKNIEEVFKLNPELANAVYEALGFNKKLLSKVELIHNFAHRYNIIYDGKKIGNFELPLDLDGSSVLIGDVEIDEEYRGKGFGVETYKAAINLSPKPIESLLASPEANRVWESLVKQKLAIKTEDGYKIIKPSMTSQQEQQAKEIYSQYLETIFPKSVIKNIVYHGTLSEEIFDKFTIGKSKEFDYSHNSIFATSSIEDAKIGGTGGINEDRKFNVLPLLLNIEEDKLGVLKEGYIVRKDTDTFNLPKNDLDSIIKDSEEHWKEIGWEYTRISDTELFLKKPDRNVLRIGVWKNDKLIMDLSDNIGYLGDIKESQVNILKENEINGVIIENAEKLGLTEKNKKWYIVLEPEQVYILGSKSDIEKFKEFIKIKNEK